MTDDGLCGGTGIACVVGSLVLQNPKSANVDSPICYLKPGVCSLVVDSPSVNRVICDGIDNDERGEGQLKLEFGDWSEGRQFLAKVLRLRGRNKPVGIVYGTAGPMDPNTQDRPVKGGSCGNASLATGVGSITKIEKIIY